MILAISVQLFHLISHDIDCHSAGQNLAATIHHSSVFRSIYMQGSLGTECKL